jgi:hypothetical protein
VWDFDRKINSISQISLKKCDLFLKGYLHRNVKMDWRGARLKAGWLVAVSQPHQY